MNVFYSALVFFFALPMSKGGLSNVTQSRCSPFPSFSGEQADRRAWQLLRSFSHSLVIRLHGRPSLSRRLFPETFSLRLIFRRDWTSASLSWWLSDSQWFIVPLRSRTRREYWESLSDWLPSYKFFPVSRGSPAINWLSSIKKNNR